MARHRHMRKDHDHDYEVFPTSAGLVRLICGSCGQVGVGLEEEFVDLPRSLRADEARSVLEAISAGPSEAVA